MSICNGAVLFGSVVEVSFWPLPCTRGWACKVVTGSASVRVKHFSFVLIPTVVVGFCGSVTSVGFVLFAVMDD